MQTFCQKYIMTHLFQDQYVINGWSLNLSIQVLSNLSTHHFLPLASLPNPKIRFEAHFKMNPDW